VKVDVRCKKCGQQKRLEIGKPVPGQALADYLRILHDRLTHRPSFECFGGHFELKPPMPEFWEVRWDSVGED
jgi:hypothetical protein